MRSIPVLVLALLFATGARGEDVAGRACSGGAHQQPDGPFAVYVFCDDAVGTNIAVFYSGLGEPRYPKWTVTKRFWQSDAWGADVSAFAWVPHRNFVIVTTSEVYGTGGVYLLDLERQTSSELAKPNGCETPILGITDHSVTVGITDCEHEKPVEQRVVAFTLPPPSPN